MAAAAILFRLKINLGVKLSFLHYIMNTQFKFDDNRLNGSKL